MMGYQVCFYTRQDRKYAGLPLGEWLIQEAKSLDIRGATLFNGVEGFGMAHIMHSAHFFELADQPLVAVLVMTELEKNRFMGRLQELDLKIFYVSSKVEFGISGE